MRKICETRVRDGEMKRARVNEIRRTRCWLGQDVELDKNGTKSEAE